MEPSLRKGQISVVCVCVDRVVDAQTQIWRPVDNAGHESEEGPDEGARRKGCGFTKKKKAFRRLIFNPGLAINSLNNKEFSEISAT